MESLKLSFEAIAPIFLLMLLGYILKSLKITDKKGFDTINKFVFNVFLPVLLFYNIYKTKTAQVFDLKLIIFTVVCVIAIFILGYAAVFALTKDNSKRGVMHQGFFRSNFAILGIPLVDYICRGQASGLTSLMVAVIIPVYNILAVITLERFREGNEKTDIMRLIKGIVTNPLIIGCVIGIVFYCLKIQLPQILEKSVKDVSAVATPLSIIVLGASFEFSSIKGSIKEILAVVLARLILIPLIIVPIAIWFGFTGEALACILITFAAPIAVSSFSMAQQMGGDENLSAQTIVISSVMCLLTLFFWIFTLSYLGLF